MVSRFPLGQQGLEARLRSPAEALGSGAIRATLEFWFQDAFLTSHSAIWSDYERRVEVAELLAQRTGLDQRLLADELARLELILAHEAPEKLDAGLDPRSPAEKRVLVRARAS